MKNLFLTFLLLPWLCHAHKATPPSNNQLILEASARIIENDSVTNVGIMKWENYFTVPSLVRKALHSGVLIASTYHPAMIVLHFLPYLINSRTSISLSGEGEFPIDLTSYRNLEKLLKRAIQREKVASHENPYSFDRRILGIDIFVNRIVGAGVAYARGGEGSHVYDLFHVNALKVLYENSNFGLYAPKTPNEWYEITLTSVNPVESCSHHLLD